MTRTKTPRRKRPGQVCGLVLLALALVSQPVLALIGWACLDEGCGTGSACCCAESSAAVDDAALAAESCCAAEPEPSEAPADDEGCGCRADTTSFPEPEAPSVPVSADSPAEWVRVHAALAALTPAFWCMPPRSAQPPYTRPIGTAGGLAADAACEGRWTLVTRGVTGFLAVLSLARL